MGGCTVCSIGAMDARWERTRDEGRGTRHVDSRVCFFSPLVPFGPAATAKLAPHMSSHNHQHLQHLQLTHHQHPLHMALATAASPIYRGLLSLIDCQQSCASTSSTPVPVHQSSSNSAAQQPSSRPADHLGQTTIDSAIVRAPVSTHVSDPVLHARWTASTRSQRTPRRTGNPLRLWLTWQPDDYLSTRDTRHQSTCPKTRPNSARHPASLHCSPPDKRTRAADERSSGLQESHADWRSTRRWHTHTSLEAPPEIASQGRARVWSRDSSYRRADLRPHADVRKSRR